MPFYPLFFDLQNRPVLIVGGGHVALEKARRLLKTGCRLMVVAPRLIIDFEALPITIKKRPWKPEDIEGAFLVIAATDDPVTNQAIYQQAAKQNILVNVVDQPSISTCLFGAAILQEDLSIGISTSGASPSAAQYLKKEITQMIPDQFDIILQWLKTKRPAILANYPANERSALFASLFYACLNKGGPLNESEYQLFLSSYTRN